MSSWKPFISKRITKLLRKKVQFSTKYKALLFAVEKYRKTQKKDILKPHHLMGTTVSRLCRGNLGIPDTVSPRHWNSTPKLQQCASACDRLGQGMDGPWLTSGSIELILSANTSLTTASTELNLHRTGSLSQEPRLGFVIPRHVCEICWQSRASVSSWCVCLFYIRRELDISHWALGSEENVGWDFGAEERR